MRIQSCSTSEDVSAMVFLATTELYSFFVSIPQEKSDKVSWTICQNFCSCYPFRPEKLAKIQGVWTVPKWKDWCRNQYFSQTILYIYKEWTDPLFLRRKTTVIHHINVLLSYLPRRTLSRLFRVVQLAICWFLLLLLLCHAKEHVAEGS